jgi:hypothetical protein
MSVAVLALVFSLTMVMVFHYPQASDTTAVLGVVLPTLTLVLGGIAGSGAGRAVGSAGKQQVQQNLDVADRKLTSASEESVYLITTIAPMTSRLRSRLVSPPGRSHLMLYGGQSIEGQVDWAQEEPLADLEELDKVTASLARLQTLLEPT